MISELQVVGVGCIEGLLQVSGVRQFHLIDRIVVVVVNIPTLPCRVDPVVVIDGLLFSIVGSADEVCFELAFKILSSTFHITTVRSKSVEMGLDLDTCNGECYNISVVSELFFQLRAYF